MQRKFMLPADFSGQIRKCNRNHVHVWWATFPCADPIKKGDRFPLFIFWSWSIAQLEVCPDSGVVRGTVGVAVDGGKMRVAAAEVVAAVLAPGGGFRPGRWRGKRWSRLRVRCFGSCRCCLCAFCVLRSCFGRCSATITPVRKSN